MNPFVFSLDSLAVTEYTTPFTGVSGDYETSSAGLFVVGGSTDDGVRISPACTFGMALGDSGRQQRAEYLYLHGRGTDGAVVDVKDGKGKTYRYRSQARHAQVSRFLLGRGIRDNYLTVALTFSGAAPLSLDRLVFEGPESANRRM